MVALGDIIDFIVTCTVGSTTDSRALDRYCSIGDMLACGEIYDMSEDISISTLLNDEASAELLDRIDRMNLS